MGTYNIVYLRKEINEAAEYRLVRMVFTGNSEGNMISQRLQVCTGFTIDGGSLQRIWEDWNEVKQRHAQPH